MVRERSGLRPSLTHISGARDGSAAFHWNISRLIELTELSRPRKSVNASRRYVSEKADRGRKDVVDILRLHFGPDLTKSRRVQKKKKKRKTCVVMQTDDGRGKTAAPKTNRAEPIESRKKNSAPERQVQKRQPSRVRNRDGEEDATAE